MLFLIILALGVGSLFINVWWIICPFALLAGAYFGKSSKHSFWSAFISNSLIWLTIPVLKIIKGNVILLQKMAEMFFLPHWSFLVVIAVFIGGLLSALSALSGYLIKNFIFDKYFNDSDQLEK